MHSLSFHSQSAKREIIIIIILLLGLCLCVRTEIIIALSLKVTEKLLEAEKKKLAQLELQLDEEVCCGTSSIEKVRLLFLDSFPSLYCSCEEGV